MTALTTAIEQQPAMLLKKIPYKVRFPFSCVCRLVQRRLALYAAIALIVPLCLSLMTRLWSTTDA